MTPMNDCQRFRDEWIETVAAPPEAAAHAAECESCRRRLADHAETWAALGRDADACVPDGFRPAVWRRIGAAERTRVRRAAVGIGASVAAALLLVALFRPAGDGDDVAAPPAELLSNLDLYENLEFIEREGEELDWIAAMSNELDDGFSEDRWE